MALKRIIRDYFTFNNRERRGIIGILVILSLAVGIHLYWRFQTVEAVPLSSDELEALQKLSSMKTEDAPTHVVKAGERNQKRQNFEASDAKAQTKLPPEWVQFDPNTVSENVLIKTGLKPWLAERLVKYRQAGGKYRALQDLKKLYGMDSLWLAEATPYLIFPAPQLAVSDAPRVEQKTRKKSIVPLDLNRVDSAAFEALPGIGPFYAGQIVELRQELGGYFHHEQLQDIYKIREETLELLKKHTFIDSTAIVYIPLNSANKERLAAHKYLTWKTAKIIIAYRIAHGPYRSKEDILKTDVVSDEMYRKIAPYLSLE